MSESVEVYRTPSEEDARFMSALLAESGIPSELSVREHDGAQEASLSVAAAAEEEAVRVISEHLEGRGMRPDEGGAELTGGALCPNCARPVPAAAGDPCEECGYAVRPAPESPLTSFGRAFPDATSCCPECCSPSTLASGSCPDCAVPLESAEPDAPVCPEGLHMLVKGEAPGWVCPGCRAAWLEG